MLYVLSRKGGWEFHSAQCDSKLSVYKGGNETRMFGAAVGARFIPSLDSTLTQQIGQVPWNSGGGFGGATGRRGPGAHTKLAVCRASSRTGACPGRDGNGRRS